MIRCIGKDKIDSSDITTLLNIKLINTSLLSREITGYYIEIKTHKGWTRFGKASLISYHSPFYIAFNAPNDLRTMYLDFSQVTFDNSAYSHVIEPGHSIMGWVFLNFYHGEIPELTWDKTELRMTIDDSIGYRTRIKILPPKEDSLGIFDLFKIMPKDWKPDCIP